MCFKKDTKERIAPIALLDLVTNEITRMQRQSRPPTQIAHPVSPTQMVHPLSPHPLSPSNV